MCPSEQLVRSGPVHALNILVQVVETIIWSVLGLRNCTCVHVLDTILVRVVILVTGALLLVHLVGLNTKNTSCLGFAPNLKISVSCNCRIVRIKWWQPHS